MVLHGVVGPEAPDPSNPPLDYQTLIPAAALLQSVVCVQLGPRTGPWDASRPD
jgi:hypothetical protein